MRFVHIGDIHLGKLLYFQNLLEIQKDLLDQLIEYLVNNKIDVLVMAGDIYDRSVPSNESIEVLNEFLNKAIIENHIKVLMIAGNHDSASRLDFASSLLKHEGLYIVAYPQKEVEPIIIDDVCFYLVPFFKPSYIRYLYNEPNLLTYQDAFKYYMDKIKLDDTKTNVLVTHQFIAGNKEVIKSESEVVLSVGGSEIIDVSLVEKFDYVALGHIHAPQKIKRDTIRYSGSLMRYSFDEVKQDKSIVDVTIKNKEVDMKFISLKPLHDLVKYQDTFDNLVNNHEGNDNDFVSIELLDEKLVPNAIDYLKNKFPKIMQITYPNLINQDTTNLTKAEEGFEQLEPIELFEEFYNKIKGQDLDEESKQIMIDLLEGGDDYVA